MDTKPPVYYALSTHWDREWHKPFQGFRYRLVKLLDDVIDALETGVLRGPFQCDGQSVVLEDYLEIRPEQHETVRRLAAEGRLAVGPWFVMPDEFLVSGESLVRNLRMGCEQAQALAGEPARAGFVNDIFGHCSQLPQIFAGFGLKAAFLWRGTNLPESRWMLWEGADGTRMPTYRFFHTGYSDFAVQVRGASNADGPFDEATRREKLARFVASETDKCAGLPVLLFDGSDHLALDRACYALIAEQIDGEAGWRHGALADYAEAVLAADADLEVLLRGELREPGKHGADVDQQWVIPGVLSSRPSLKLANAACEAKLCQWAEPLWTWSSKVFGTAYPEGFLRTAWHWLLQNHPHDSICGCSIDAVHEDMHFRFRQSRQIADELIEEAALRVAASVQGTVGDDEVRCLVFNSLATPRRGVVDLEIGVPAGWPSFQEFFGYEAKPAFTLWDAEGREIPYQRLRQEASRVDARTNPLHHPQPRPTNPVRVAVTLDLPACGYQTITIRKGEPGVPTRYPATPSLVTGRHRMENSHLRVDAETDGTLTVLDKRTGEAYGGLLGLEDAADIGDGWYHGQAANDEVFSSLGASHEIAVVHDGPQLGALRIRTRMRVPAEFDFTKHVRAEDTVELVLNHRVTLAAGADSVDIETELDNTACDHRLRVVFPTQTATETYLSDTPFDVVQRAVALDPETHLYRELDTGTGAQHSWSALHDGKRGLAVAAAGMHEVTVRDDDERALRLTMLRATRRTIFTQGEPGGQELGKQRFHYRIVPLAGAPERRRLCEMGQELRAGIRAIHCDARDQAAFQMASVLPPSDAPVTLEGPVVLTAFERRGEALLVRCFNPEAKEAPCTLRLSPRLAEGLSLGLAYRVDLENREQGDALPMADCAVAFEAGAKEIVTLRLG